jgi:transcriptional regulator with XRE-family HTH domain
MKRKEIPSEHQEALNAISTYIRELRFSEGLTQLELSQQINLHRNSIQRAEGGKNITLLTIFELADAFDISPTDIISIID